MTSMSGQKLDQVPAEIIHHILAQGPCTNALALSRVNKSLRAASTNPLVYDRIVASGNSTDEHPDSFQEHNSSTWWIERGFRHEQDWHVCARWALADMKTRDAFFQRSKFYDSSTDFLSLFPELLSQSHVLAQKTATEADGFGGLHDDVFWRCQFEKADLISSKPRYVERVTRAAFVYAYCCTMLPVSAEHAVPSPQSHYPTVRQRGWESCLPPALGHAIKTFSDILEPGQDPQNADALLDFEPGMIFRLEHDESKPYWLRCITLCTVIAGILHRGLACVVRQTNSFPHRRTATRGIRNLSPPTASDVPFEVLFPNKPPPFSIDEISSETSPFMARHIPVMTSSSFLTDGEWVGYYNYAVGRRVPNWDPMMDGIVFKITADDSCYRHLRAGGVDAVGTFILVGTINITNGWVRMTKHYTNTGHSFRWSAIMTALGIVGAWDDNAWGGWFWLWKKSWSR